ncbi:BTB/POZ domain-containing protein 9-like, partial [Sitodiplosis mosellana]|uniref:BTB/POZ domain-containing protein 9-like n=1 Tax=Sitodiplosis mosellana TaxID=263140 RepID=UPI002443847E
EILQLLSDICMNDEHADVTFVVENEKIPAHKTILSLRSSYFRSLFGGAFAESAQAEVELEVPVNAFKAILKYMYTGCLSLAALESHQIIEVYDLAEQYDFSASMKKIILDYLTANLTLDNCGSILNAAHLYSIKDLQTACMKFMDSHSMELLGCDSFLALSLTSLCTLLKRDSFYALEIDIFKAVCNWLAHNSDADVKQALSTVRWSELSMDDYMNIVEPSNILDPAQLWHVMKDNRASSGTAGRTQYHSLNTQKDVEENIATAEHGAKIVSGENPSAILSGIFRGNLNFGSDYLGSTYHAITDSQKYHDSGLSKPISNSITVDLGKVTFINYIKMLLMGDRSYSYYVDVSADGKEYIRLFDHSNHNYRSWQYLYFQSRPIRFIKLIGTRATRLVRYGYARGGDGRASYHGYYSFEVVGLQAIHKTTNFPELVDGVIKPTANVAKVEHGANVEGA